MAIVEIDFRVVGVGQPLSEDHEPAGEERGVDDREQRDPAKQPRTAIAADDAMDEEPGGKRHPFRARQRHCSDRHCRPRSAARVIQLAQLQDHGGDQHERVERVLEA